MGHDAARMLKSVATAAGAAATHDLAQAQAKDHDHGHSHQAVPSDPALRVKSLNRCLWIKRGWWIALLWMH